MPIQDTDLFLVSNSGSKKCEAQNLNGKTGNVLVNRNGVSHKTGIVNIPTTVLDDDLMLVNRGGASFKATGAEVQTLFPQGPAGGTDVITDVVDGEIAGEWSFATATEIAGWKSVAYGAGKFVAVANSGTDSSGTDRLMYSTDGITWRNDGITGAVDNQWRSITYAPDIVNDDGSIGLFVAVAAGGSGTLIWSSDGLTWGNSGVPRNNDWSTVRYGNGRFVAVANGGGSGSGLPFSMYSSDGKAWVGSATSLPQTTWNSLAYGDGVWVALGYNRSSYSVDGGDNWTPLTTTIVDNTWYSVVYGNGKFVAVGSGSGTDLVMYSEDGINWKNDGVNGISSKLWYSITYGDGKFVAAAYSGETMHSVDGISWTVTAALPQTGGNPNSWDITFGGDKFVAVSTAGGTTTINNMVMWSYTGTGEVGDKSDLTLASDKNLDTFTPGDGLQMVDSDGDTAAYVPITSAITAATPGIIPGGWNNGNNIIAGDIAGVVYGNGTWVAITGNTTLNNPANRQIMYSTNGGISWTATTQPEQPLQWTSVTYGVTSAAGAAGPAGTGLFVAVAKSGNPDRVIYSVDGITWFSRPATQQIAWTSVTYGKGRFVAAGQRGINGIMWSDNGVDWTVASSLPNSNHPELVAYGNGEFLCVCNTGNSLRSLSSPDGDVWSTTDPLPENNVYTGLAYGNGTWVAVSITGTRTMYRPNGGVWTRSNPTDNSATWNDVAFGDGIFLAVSQNGGGSADERGMWSTDGLNWNATVITGSNYTACAYGGGKWMAAGYNVIYWSNTGTDDGLDVTTLALTPTSKDLKYFNPGDKVTQAANFGTVKSVGTDELVLRDTELSGPWTPATPTKYNYISSLYAAGLFLIGADGPGNDNKFFYSTDGGESWTASAERNGDWWYGLTYGNGKFFALAYQGSLKSTTPANIKNSWTQIVDLGRYAWRDVIYADNKIVCVGQERIVYSDDEGSSFQFGYNPSSKPFFASVAYGAGKFVAVGSIDLAVYSDDGSSWTEVTTPINDNRSITHGVTSTASADHPAGTALFVAVADNGDKRVMHSTDGISWTAVTVPTAKWNSVTYGNGKFVATASAGTTISMYSTDAVSWSTASVPEDCNWTTVSYGGGRFLAASNTALTNRVIWSETGTGTDEISDWTTSIGQGAEVDKSLSGTGTYGSHTGSVLTVNNSNAEWVDNDNQRGEDFYATTGTTRLSLAKALSIEDYGVMTASARQWAATAIAGYYPLYRFERIAKLVGDGTAHSHTFDGVTWYMPNGVTYYHGDYSGY